MGLPDNGNALMIEPIIQFIDVHKSFEGVNGAMQKVLRGVNLSIRPGMTTVIGGASGQGKSVTVKLILGLMKPDTGQVLVEGKDVTTMASRELNEIRSKFGVVFQGVAPFDSMTVFDNVALPLREKTKLTKKDTELTLNAFWKVIQTSLKKKHTVRLIPYGNFEVRHRAARTGRNPRTGGKLKIKARNVPAFKPGKALKDVVK